MRIVLAADHAGFELKERLKTALVEWGHEVADLGASGTTSVDYPDFAHQAAEEGNGPKAARLLWATIGGATTFLLVKAFEWSHEIRHGYTITADTFWSFYYTAAGLHAAHVLAGAIVMVFVARSAARNEELHRVELAGIYWHFVDIVWIFLFPLLYIAK